MSEAHTDSTEALLTLIDMAQQEISDVVTNLQAEGSKEFLQLCLDHIENIGWASEMAGLGDLNTAAEAIHSHLGAENLSLNPEQGAELLAWLSDIKLYIASPDDADLVGLLLNPLPAEAQNAVTEAIAEESTAAEIESMPQVSAVEIEHGQMQDAPDIGDFEHDFEHNDTNAFGDDEDTGFDTSDMLGMLASELHDAYPQLSELAEAIAASDDTDQLEQAVGSYQELVSRVRAVSEELGLIGLVLVCDFVNKNSVQVAAMSLAERANSLEVLQGWPIVIVEHLVNPEDDDLCIAVVDYLERENWPEPLPYREVRSLIEGLTKELELSNSFEPEVREIEATAEDVSLEISTDASPELIDAFFAESPGHAEKFSHLMEAISSGEDIQNNVEAAQRIAHTLKGSGNLVGVKGIANLSHHIEDIFEYIAKHKITPPPSLANILQEAADTIEAMLECLQDMAPAPDNAQRVLQDVLDWANRIDSGNLRHDDYEAEASTDVRPAKTDEESDESQHEFIERRKRPETEAAVAASRTEAVRVPLNVLDNIFRIVSETAITIGQIQERLGRLESNDKLIRKNDGSLQQLRYELENLVSIRGMAARHRSAVAGGSSAFDPLEMDEYDEFYGATHAYIEGVADSREILRGFTNEVSELHSLFLLQQRLNKELQEMVMSTRMVPVSIIAPRLQRAVRQVCRATGKQAELTIVGQDLLLDGDVLNKLADPLMHMLRNAVDHSIETGEVRFDKGKPTGGNITLSFQQEGNNVVVNCADDGSGLNYERIREVAIRKGLLSDREPTDNQSLGRMILQTGFSTRDKVTQVSGRGVGMDVVHNTIQSLNGTMEVSDADSGGTLVSLRLPITLLTSHCLLAGVGKDRVFAIPAISLTQILSPGAGKIGRVGDDITYQLGQDVYTAYTLNSLVGIADEEDADKIENSSVLLLQTAEGITAVIVDRVVSSYDLVIKNMGAYVKSVRGIAGVSMLGNGSVVAVLDLPALLQNRGSSDMNRISSSANSSSSREIALPKVLIVDDSLSVRSSLSQLMTDGGYQAVTARDGIEAVNMLESENPDIVLTDLEMPRMNGLDLVSYIRNSSQWKPLPVVMITSRTMAKHRQQAELAGVNRYITKPFTEDEVLASIDEQLSSVA